MFYPGYSQQICHPEIQSIANEYTILIVWTCLLVGRCVWEAFADSVMLSFYSSVYCVVLVFLQCCIGLHVCFMAALWNRAGHYIFAL